MLKQIGFERFDPANATVYAGQGRILKILGQLNGDMVDFSTRRYFVCVRTDWVDGYYSAPCYSGFHF